MHANRLGPTWLCGLLAVILAIAAAGCGEPTAGEFKAYDELEGRPAQSAVDPDKDEMPGASSNPHLSAAADSPADSPGSPHEPSSPPALAEHPADTPDADEPGTEPASDPASAESGLPETARPVANGSPPDPAPAVAVAAGVGPETRPVGDRVLPADTLPQADSSSAPDDAADDDPPEPREVRLLVPHREFRTEGPEGALRISYDDIDLLKVLNMEPVTPNAPSLMPDWLKDLDGQRVRVRGFMYPTFQETGIERFILARDNDICCFGRDPKIYDLIRVTMRAGKATHYIEGRPFDVVGVFRIQPAADDGKLYQLYQLEDALVIQR